MTCKWIHPKGKGRCLLFSYYVRKFKIFFASAGRGAFYGRIMTCSVGIAYSPNFKLYHSNVDFNSICCQNFANSSKLAWDIAVVDWDSYDSRLLTIILSGMKHISVSLNNIDAFATAYGCVSLFIFISLWVLAWEVNAKVLESNIKLDRPRM